MSDDRWTATEVTLPNIGLKEVAAVTPEEIERRRLLVARMRELRAAIGPIGVSAEELIHELRGGDDRFDE